jgi:exodeoxyribonuclease VII small subunit
MAKKTFEDAMRSLEQIVQELEDGDLPLETAFKKFEEGVQLSKFCSQKLDETEKKITILLKDQNGSLTEKPFQSQGVSEPEKPQPSEDNL